MARDREIAVQVYDFGEIAEIFQGKGSLDLEVFKQRGGGNATLDSCLHFFDVVFFPVIKGMEYTMATSQLFGRPLQYVLMKEDSSIPNLLQLCTHQVLAQMTAETPLDTLFQLENCDAFATSLAHDWNIDSGKLAVAEHISNIEDPAVLIALVRKFLEELPEPLVPFAFFAELMSLETLNVKSLAGELERLMKGLPLTHRQSLRRVVNFITDLATKQSAHSERRCEQVCGVFGPLLIRPRRPEQLDTATKAQQRTQAIKLLKVIVVEGERSFL
jgi:hypothetical protein